MKKNKHINIYNGHRAFLVVALCFFVVCLIAAGRKPAKKRGRAVKKVTDTRVYLQHADELTYDVYGKHPNAQFAKGHVQFLHKGAHLSCDSALFFQQSNSFEAFGHVKMRQGDTLTLTSEYAYYDGNDEMAEARRNVVLTHRKTKLFCDSLNYDRMYSIGYFFEGGKLIDGGTTLTSDWGQYSSADRQAVFYYDVHLKNKKFYIEGDTLHYDTRTSLAHFTGPTKITSTDKDIINSTDAFFNSNTERSELFSRSTIVRPDGKTITADSLYHDSKTGISEGFSNVEFNDTANKTAFTGDYIYYDENEGFGKATRNAIMMDYSQGDTLYAHGDTMKLFTYNVNTDSVYRVVHAHPHIRVYRKDMQAVADSVVMTTIDSTMVMYKDPILWSDGRQIVGEEIHVYMADSTIRFAHVIGQAMTVEMHPDSVHFDQISSTEMKAWFTDGKLRLNQAQGNVKTVFYPIDSADSTLIGLNYLETDTMRAYMGDNRQLERIWVCKHNGTTYPITQIPEDKYKLPNFGWFDYIRPLSKDDLLEWRPKKKGSELKAEKRRSAPVREFKDKQEALELKNEEPKAEGEPDNDTPVAEPKEVTLKEEDAKGE